MNLIHGLFNIFNQIRQFNLQFFLQNTETQICYTIIVNHFEMGNQIKLFQKNSDYVRQSLHHFACSQCILTPTKIRIGKT